MTDNSWPDVIRRRRETLGLSQAQLARTTGLHKGTLQRYEAGEREPPLSVARAIAEALDISLAELSGQVPAGLGAPSPTGAALSAVGEVLQSRRHDLGLTQTRVAGAAGIPPDLYQRYESGDAELPLAAAATLADVLDVPLTVLAGAEPRSIEFNGRWWATWQAGALRPGDADFHTVEALHAGNRLILDKGWRGELELFGNEVLIGWYRPPGRGTRTRQGVFLWLPAGGDYLYGRWTGVADNNTVDSGWCVLARDDTQSREVFTALVSSSIQPRPLPRLPRIGTWGSNG